MSALKSLLGDMSTEVFFNDFWENAPLHIKKCEGLNLPRLLDFENLLNYADLRTPMVRAFIGGELVPEKEFTKSWQAGDEVNSNYVNIDALKRLITVGATISLKGIDRRILSLWEICRSIEKELGWPSHATAFITPPNAKNTTPHYDVTDNFIVQVAGGKLWKIWNKDSILPLKHEHHILQESIAISKKTAPIKEVYLNAGDILFIPRGHLHEVYTMDENSLHVVIAIEPIRIWGVINLAVKKLVKELHDDPNFRRSVPLSASFTESLDKELSSILLQLKTKIQNNIVWPDICNGVLNEFVDSRWASRPGQIMNTISVLDGNYNDETIFSHRHNLIFSAKYLSDEIVVSFQGKTLHFSMNFIEELNYILLTKEFRIVNIIGSSSKNNKTSLVKRLVCEGILIIL